MNTKYNGMPDITRVEYNGPHTICTTCRPSFNQTFTISDGTFKIYNIDINKQKNEISNNCDKRPKK